jgi:hypothetical protein
VNQDLNVMLTILKDTSDSIQAVDIRKLRVLTMNDLNVIVLTLIVVAL